MNSDIKAIQREGKPPRTKSANPDLEQSRPLDFDWFRNWRSANVED